MTTSTQDSNAHPAQTAAETADQTQTATSSSATTAKDTDQAAPTAEKAIGNNTPPLLQWIAIALGTAGTITKALVWNHTNVYDGD